MVEHDLETAVRDVDRRLAFVERDMVTVLEFGKKIDQLRSDLAEPQGSPLGRRLLERADTNATNLNEHDKRIDSLETSRSEMVGAAKGLRAVQWALALAVIILTLIQVADKLTT